MPSGFHAYWVYCAVKMMHFGSSKYDITKMGLPRKEMFLNKWNLNDPNFHISHVLNDKMSLYKRNELELDAIVDTVRGDFVSALNYCHNKGMNYGQMFGHYKGNAPFVLRLYDRGKISVNSIVAMNLAFNYQDINPDKKPDIMTGLNPIDQEKMKMWTKIFVEYYKVVYNYFQDRNWNIFFKELYNSFQA
jgi:hypothetical protein